MKTIINYQEKLPEDKTYPKAYISPTKEEILIFNSPSSFIQFINGSLYYIGTIKNLEEFCIKKGLNRFYGSITLDFQE